MATDVSHAPTQLNLLGSTPTHGLGRPFYATMDSSSTQSTIFPEEMPAFKMGPPPNTSPLYLGGAGMPVMTGGSPVAMPTGAIIPPSPSLKVARQPNASQETYMTTDSHINNFFDCVQPITATSEGPPQEAGDISLSLPTSMPHSFPSHLTATMAPGPSLREIESILKQSSQESEKPYPSASRPDLGPGSSILEQSKTSTIGSGSPSFLSLNRKASTTATYLSDTDLIATTPQFSNPSSSPPGPGKSRKREIKVKLEEPQEGPERKRWYTLTVNDEDDVIRNLDRRMAEIFRPLQIYFSWDQYDLQKPKTKQRVCNLEELVEELVENQWGALERKISWFYLVQKGRKAAHD
ncbi:hypothetical protein TWF679_004656 [Orbilia oligospora]|uniref:Uncharacterized protein n=1 Tax=Orbilia oligospora TaxID=2813651 RepID=A0A8H8VDW1_ORBOL|nr:hypothetical protein TWF679_004656 [Orbilia oligospora]